MCIGHSSLDRTLDCFQRRCLPILLSIVLNCFLAGVSVAAGTSHRQRPLSAAFAAVDRSGFGVVMAAAEAAAGDSAPPPWILAHGIHDLGIAHFAHLKVRDGGKP